MARELGAELAARHIGLVYGGASVGVMGALADAVLAGQGEVMGVIPHGVFGREVAHTGLSELHVVKTMHERKALMNELSDAFLALPGGLGTFDELFEALTWRQLGLHDKPVGVLDVGGYFTALFDMLQRGRQDGFFDDSPLATRTDSVDATLRVLLPGAHHPHVKSAG